MEAAPVETEDFSGLSADEAIPRLMEEHGGKLFGLGLRLCGSPEDAEELVQEIFLAAFRKWDQFEGRAKPTTWLYTIASRACMRRHRKRAGEPDRFDSLSSLVPLEDRRVPELPSTEEGPFEHRLKAEVQEALEGALRSVPQNFRMPLILKDIAELSLAEIAEILDIKPETAKTRVHRGRLALRRELSRSLPQRPVDRPDEPPICMDLLEAKLEALDRGAEFPVPEELISDRCESFFRSLDLTTEVCREVGRGEMPVEARSRIEARLRRAAESS